MTNDNLNYFGRKALASGIILVGLGTGFIISIDNKDNQIIDRVENIENYVDNYKYMSMEYQDKHKSELNDSLQIRQELINSGTYGLEKKLYYNTQRYNTLKKGIGAVSFGFGIPLILVGLMNFESYRKNKKHKYIKK